MMAPTLAILLLSDHSGRERCFWGGRGAHPPGGGYGGLGRRGRPDRHPANPPLKWHPQAALFSLGITGDRVLYFHREGLVVLGKSGE